MKLTWDGWAVHYKINLKEKAFSFFWQAMQSAGLNVQCKGQRGSVARCHRSNLRLYCLDFQRRAASRSKTTSAQEARKKKPRVGTLWKRTLGWRTWKSKTLISRYGLSDFYPFPFFSHLRERLVIFPFVRVSAFLQMCVSDLLSFCLSRFTFVLYF